MDAGFQKWFKDERKRLSLHKIDELRPEMFGKSNSPSCNLHAAETNTFLLYIVHLIGQHVDDLPMGRLALRVGRGLCQQISCLKPHSYVLSNDVIQCLHDATTDHLLAVSRRGFHEVPKHHFSMHWAHRSHVTGNPLKHTTFEDEHINGVVKPIANKAHKLRWSETVLLTTRQVLKGKLAFKRRPTHG